MPVDLSGGPNDCGANAEQCGVPTEGEDDDPLGPRLFNYLDRVSIVVILREHQNRSVYDILGRNHAYPAASRT